MGRPDSCNNNDSDADTFEGEEGDVEDNFGVLKKGVQASINHDETTAEIIEEETTCSRNPFPATCLVPSRYRINENVEKSTKLPSKKFLALTQEKQIEINTTLFNELIRLISWGNTLHCSIHGSSTSQLTGLERLRADGKEHPYLDSMFVGGDGRNAPELYLINLLSCIHTTQCYSILAVERDKQKNIRNSDPIIVLVHPSGLSLSEPSASSRGKVALDAIKDKFIHRFKKEKFKEAMKINFTPHNKQYTEKTLFTGNPALVHLKSTKDQYVAAIDARELNEVGNTLSPTAVGEFALLKMALKILLNDHQSPGGAVNRIIST